MKLTSFLSLLEKFMNFERTPEKKALALSRMRALCEKLSHPENFTRVIHIAGTKGKGSTAAFTAAFLTEAGYECGVYSSPHVYDFRERVRRGSHFFSDEIYEEAADEVIHAAESFDEAEEKPTWFELVTAFAFVCFRIARVDFAILEVGLGGRLDATNVVAESVAVLLNIELEHTRFLGDTIEKIAREKCAIIKEGAVVVISSDVNEEARKIYLEKAREMHAKAVESEKECSLLGEEFFDRDARKIMKVRFSSGGNEIEAESDMLGSHQSRNMLSAYSAVKETLQSETFAKKTRFTLECDMKARFEIIHAPPLLETIVSDGAHTPLSVENTLLCAQKVFPSRKFHVLFGTANDKNIKGIAEKIALSPAVSSVTLTTYFSERSSKIEAMKPFFPESSHAEEKLEDAFRFAVEKARADEAILLILGSFYLASDVKKLMRLPLWALVPTLRT